MKLQKFLPKRYKHVPVTPRDHNPFAGYLSADPSTRPKTRSPSSSPSYPSSPAMSSPSSVVSSPTTSPAHHKRPLVDQLFERENDQLTEAFRIIDTDGDGKISEQDLGATWKRLGKKIKEKELRLMIQEADMNGDGVLDLQEFVAFFGKMVAHPEVDDPIQHAKHVRVAFDVSDVCRDGLVSAAELQIVMGRLKKGKVTAAECAAMIKCVDSDGDGLITFTEFEKLMMSSVFSRQH